MFYDNNFLHLCQYEQRKTTPDILDIVNDFFSSLCLWFVFINVQFCATYVMYVG